MTPVTAELCLHCDERDAEVWFTKERTLGGDGDPEYDAPVWTQGCRACAEEHCDVSDLGMTDYPTIEDYPRRPPS